MLVLVGISFVAGLITAISPCVLPVLPILLAGGASSGSRARPYAIVGGLVLSFTVFTLVGAALLDLLGLPQDFLRDLAIALLLVLAATLLVPRLGDSLARPFLFLTRRRAAANANGFVLGASLGLVFVPCAGPVLAAVTALAATGRVGVETFVVTGSYALGAALPMLLYAIGSRRLASALALLRTHAQATRAAAGALIGAAAIAIAVGADTRFTTAVPGYTEALQDGVERSAAAQRELRRFTGSEDSAPAGAAAPEFRGISLWLNTPRGQPLSLRRLRGKVVLLDFWTYSCINCLRTLPHLQAWHETYRKDGLVIVGVHAPEFAFEREAANVRAALRRLGIRYPVAIDNDFATWHAYRNRYWPAKYLIDRSGRVRWTHFGEGDYEEAESQIRRLLGSRVRGRRTSVADKTPHRFATPESYLGYARLTRFVGPRVVPNRPTQYEFPPSLPLDHLAYAGTWIVEPSRAVAGLGARLRLRFEARQVHLVLGGRGAVEVRVDGRRRAGVAVAGVPRLYTLASFARPRKALLELGFTPGLKAYAFTFG